MMVEMDRGIAFNSTASPFTQRKYGVALSDWFITTTTTLPSSLRNAVDSNWLRLGDAAIRLAPGLMNFEK